MYAHARKQRIIVIVLSNDSATIFTNPAVSDEGKWLPSGECQETMAELKKWLGQFIGSHSLAVRERKTVKKPSSTPKAYVFLWVSTAPKGMKAWATIDFLATLSPDDNLATRIIAQVPAQLVPDKFKAGSVPQEHTSKAHAPMDMPVSVPEEEPEDQEDQVAA
jgi:hypothetical protein